MAEETSRGRWLVVVLVLAVLVPYAPMLVGAALPFSDDIGASDLLDGEFPGRVEAARIWRAGQGAVWTPRVRGGAPLIVDPLSLALFSWLPPALALGWYLAVCLALAAAGTCVLARQYGASPAAAALAGFASSWSGVFVCQLRHLSVIGTIALFPLAVWCLERVVAPSPAPSDDDPARRWVDRAPWAMAFALVFGAQLCFAFPQSAYASALVYGVIVLVRVVGLLHRGAATGAAAGAASASSGRRVEPRRLDPRVPVVVTLILLGGMLGLGIGMHALMPLAELAGISDRAGAGSFEWATLQNYWPRNALTFLLPYVNGDITDFSYAGRNLFWEDYGYVGWLTALLAVLAGGLAITGRPVHQVGLWLGIGVVAYVFVLGKHTPVYGWAFELLPGLSRFRMPQRFLFVVELSLVLCAAQGLTWLQGFLASRLESPRPALAAAIVAWGIAAWTAVDLVRTNARQNAWVDAPTWLASPRTAATIRASGEPGRVYTPGDRRLHEEMAYAAKGWAGDLHPYVAFREHLQPNSNLLHGVDAIDGYTGLSPWWSVDLIGDHNREGLLTLLIRYERGGYAIHPATFDVLEAIGVRWLLLRTALAHERLELIGGEGDVKLHRLRDTLPRARLVTSGRHIAASEDVFREILLGRLDLRRNFVVHEAHDAALVTTLLEGEEPSTVSRGAVGEVTLTSEGATRVVLDVDAPRPALLLLADTYHPGWTATLDGAPVQVLRANVAHRAVMVPRGRHEIVFHYRAAAQERGTIVAATSLAIVALIWLVAGRARRRAAHGARTPPP
jgi:hypothetical protein